METGRIEPSALRKHAQRGDFSEAGQSSCFRHDAGRDFAHDIADHLGVMTDVEN